jgi:plasmid stabilization system protein ParE
VKVELSEEAHGQVLEIDTWWRQNRPAAPNLFTEEIDRLLLLLEARPNLGTPYDTGAKTVRRVLLRRSHYYLYVVEHGDTLQVVSVWSVYRGSRPKL